MARKSWADLSPQQRTLTVVGGTVQLALMVAAELDLRRRDPEEVNGPKPLWAVINLVNFVGPLSYFVFGRKRSRA